MPARSEEPAEAKADARGTASGGGLDWARDGWDWPNRTASRFVTAGGLRWHVQIEGSGPAALLLHGTGASTHSWRDIIPRLAPHLTVIAPDLPGHAFTAAPRGRGMALPEMAAALGDLLRALGHAPRLVVGHSAGAAILVRMCLDGIIAPAGLVSLNGALLPIGGVAGRVFSPLAKLLALNPIVPHVFAWWASDRAVVGRLLKETGSRLDAAGLAFYARLARHPAHMAGALAMMANWDLQPLKDALPQLHVPLLLVVGGRDASVPPADAVRIRDRVLGARIETIRDLGHLAHEERPEAVADIILAAAAEWRVIGVPNPLGGDSFSHVAGEGGSRV